MPDVKLAVRNYVLGKRRALSTESRKQKSQAIVDSLIDLSLFEGRDDDRNLLAT
jgi:5-formyltetrahydrofolate cyclo-ligase